MTARWRASGTRGRKNSASRAPDVAIRSGLPRPLAFRWPARSSAQLRSMKCSYVVIAGWANSVRFARGADDGFPGRENAVGPAAPRSHGAADDGDALLLMRMNVYGRRCRAAAHPEVEAQNLPAGRRSALTAPDTHAHVGRLDGFARPHRLQVSRACDATGSSERRKAHPSS